VKIIGKTKENFLLEATKNELANLVGYYSTYTDGYKSLQIGDYIKVSEMFNKLSWIENNKKKVEMLKEEFIQISRELDTFNPIFRSIDKPKKGKKNENN